MRESKHEKIGQILKHESVISETENCYNCLYTLSELNSIKGSIPKTSSHNYTIEMIEIIKRFNNGLVLDCGAGAREAKYENVVNFEIFPYDSTDVIGEGSNLPFNDQSFDAVFSLAVLEHVKDPFKVASEMQRVLKPGGLLWIDVAFMQPYHGYPHHYYNMTQSGLNALIGDNMKILQSGTPDYGLPIWSLSWILEKYAANLPESIKEEFLELKVKDLAKHGSLLLNNSYVKQLSPEANEQLAATVSLKAEKLTNSD